MDVEINRSEWETFFESLSKRRHEWKTRIEVINSEIGDQVLTEGLPLNGITAEKNRDTVTIEISVGRDSKSHQTHNITQPKSVAFLKADEGRNDVIAIEEEDGTKTLVTFLEPMAILVGYSTLDVDVRRASF